MVGRAEALEAINDLLASATIFTSASSDLLAAELERVAGDRLTFTQLRLLRLVDRQFHLAIGDVAAYLGVSSAAASKAVDRLVRSGLLARAESPGDRRATEVSVTSEGQALLAEFEARSSATLLRLLSGVGAPQLRDISGRLDRLSVSLAAGRSGEESLCFRCGLHFREDCLLRAAGDERCYLHLGSGRRGGAPIAASRPGAADRARATTGGIGR
ncbi:MAG: MarR family transcriptional regulator [Actinobacteria bacterium]|nr:MarR family transcriptional regulator [Actinomycetota bacterium]